MSKTTESPYLAALIAGAIEKRVSRRQFMERTLAAGMTVTAASSLWASKVEAATPKKGGNFRVGVHDGNTTECHKASEPQRKSPHQ